MDTEEELFYIPKSALYDNNMWQTETLGQSGPSGPSAPSGPSGASGQSWTPLPPGARLVTWRPDMNKKKQKTEAPYRPAYQPYTAARSRIVTWVPKKMKVADGGGGGGYHGQAGGRWWWWWWYRDMIMLTMLLLQSKYTATGQGVVGGVIDTAGIITTTSTILNMYIV